MILRLTITSIVLQVAGPNCGVGKASLPDEAWRSVSMGVITLSSCSLCLSLRSPKTSLRAGGTHLAVLARSVMLYLNVSLESGDMDKVSKSVNMQTTRALMALFK